MPSLKHPPSIVVAFTGRSGSGKTTIAKEVVAAVKAKHPKLAAVRKSFADPLKEMLRVIGVEKGVHPHFRKWAQRIGTDVVRSDVPSFWVDLLAKEIEDQSHPTVVCVDDSRFPDECGIADLVVRLVTNRDTGLTADQMTHPSERLWEDIPADSTFLTDDISEVQPIALEVMERSVGILGRQVQQHLQSGAA